MKSACLIILPAYNVENNLPSLLVQISDYKRNCLFINDGSIDHTPDILRDNDFNFISNAHNQGVSSSILVGLDYAISHGFDKVILMDADGQHSATSLQQITGALESVDFVFTTRFFEGSIATIPSCKLAANMLASSLFEKASGIFIPDVSCGFKGFKISTDLVSFLKQTSGYSIIYKIVSYALTNKKSYMILNTPAIYHYDTLLYTRTSEMDALLSSALELATFYHIPDKDSISRIIDSVRKKDSFAIDLSNLHFHLFYLSDYNGYIVQSPIDLLHKKLKSSYV